MSSEDEFRKQLAAARCGSRDAVGWLFARLRPYLLSISEREMDEELRSKGGASDIVQTTLLTAQQILLRFEGDSEEELRAWLRGILLNEVNDFHRRYRRSIKRKIDREVSADVEGSDGALRDLLPSPGSSPSHAAIREEEKKRLLSAISQLSEEYQKVLRLRSWDNLSFAEIGRLMNRSEDAARMLWGRAVRKLQDQLESRDG